MTTKTLEDALKKIRAMYETRLEGVKQNASRIREAIQLYEEAAREDTLGDLMYANGLAPPVLKRKADDAALELLARLEQLPELRPKTPPTPPPPPVPERAPTPTPIILHVPVEEPEPPPAPTPEPTPEAEVAPWKTEVAWEPYVPPAPAPSDEEDVEPTASMAGRFPHLHEAGKPILLFGGFCVEKKLESMHTLTGLTFEWISNERNSSGDSECKNACRQVSNKKFTGVILLNELMSHAQSKALVQAAKDSGTLHAIGKKGGTGALVEALDLFEKQLRSGALFNTLLKKPR